MIWITRGSIILKNKEKNALKKLMNIKNNQYVTMKKDNHIRYRDSIVDSFKSDDVPKKKSRTSPTARLNSTFGKKII